MFEHTVEAVCPVKNQSRISIENITKYQLSYSHSNTGTGVSWNRALKLERAVPKLEKLHLCGNNPSALRKKEDAFKSWKIRSL